MAFSGMGLTAAADVLKIHYQGPVREQLNQTNVLQDVLKRDVSRSAFRGKQAYIPLHTGRNVGIGARPESGTLARSGKQGYTSSVWHMAYLYGRISLTGPAIAAAKDSEGSFIELVDSEMKGLVRDLKRDVNRQIWHDGSGLLTGIATTSSSDPTVNCKSTRFIQQGMKIDLAAISNHAAVSSGTGVYVGAITGNSFELEDADGAAVSCTTTAGTHGVFVAGAHANSESYELWGLEALVSDADPSNHGTEAAATRVGEIDRSTNTFWQSNVVAAGAVVDSTLDDFQRAYDESEIEGDSTPGVILTSHGVRRAVAGKLTSLRQFGDELELQGGWTGMKFNNAALICDRDASTTEDPGSTQLGTYDISDGATVAANGNFNRAYFITPSSLEFQVLEDWQWMDEGGVLVRSGVGASAVDEFEATMFSYQNLITTRPKANTLLTDIATASQA